MILQWWIFRQFLNRNTSAPLDHCLLLACRCGIWSINNLKAKVAKYLLNKMKPAPCKETSDFALKTFCRNSLFIRTGMSAGPGPALELWPTHPESEPQQTKCHFLLISTWCVYSVSTDIGLPVNGGAATVYFCPGGSCCHALVCTGLAHTHTCTVLTHISTKLIPKCRHLGRATRTWRNCCSTFHNNLIDHSLEENPSVPGQHLLRIINYPASNLFMSNK